MQPFTSIESFKHVRAKVNRYCEANHLPRPTIRYQGTVKLHGSNAGVAVTSDSVQPQKRTDVVTIGKDNAGFAVFCYGKDGLFKFIATHALERSLIVSDNVTLFGEWCGGNIQKGVAVTQLDKHFVIFNAYVEGEGYKQIDWITKNLLVTDIKVLNVSGIYFINQIPMHTIDIDFSFPEKHMEELTNATLAVENECPWGKFRGVSGIGEGYVYQSLTEPYANMTDLWFKVKGLAHKVEGKTGVKGLSADPVRLTNIQEFVNEVLPLWRLEQGVSQLKEDGKEIIHQSIGDYLKWIGQDIIKECADDLAASGFSWKDVNGTVSKKARDYFLQQIDVESLNK